MTKKEAKRLSILKWEYIVNNGGDYNIDDLIDAIPELKELLYSCGYCDKYLDTHNSDLQECANCPIRPKIEDYDDTDFLGCSQNTHPLCKWSYTYTIKDAQAVLDLIKKS